MTIVDFHNHYYPPEYIKELQSGPSKISVTFDADDNPLLHSPGDINIIVPGHRDIDFRQGVLDDLGIDVQVLTFTAPGTTIETPERSVDLARMVNDCLAKIVAERPNRFASLATLPLNDPAASLRELERVTGELGFKGVMLFSNVNGVALSDERFWPLYERANELDMVFYIHPTYPVGVEAMTDYWIMPLVGFVFDTTIAAASLVFSGVVEKFPNIRWALGHLGGAIPYLAERLDRGYTAFEECRRHIAKPPSEYLKEFYYDTVNFDPKALRLAIDFAGVDHLLAGSDYPHQIGSLERMVQSINGLDLSDSEKEQVLGGNAAALLGL
ncbi:MAG: amidohydrolase family protein [Gemmatimonadetes bacterium]|nr:amidohydrolase family protein [Gemmatimonadota bacterium]